MVSDNRVKKLILVIVLVLLLLVGASYAFTGESNNYYNKMITGIRPVIEVPKSDILY